MRVPSRNGVRRVRFEHTPFGRGPVSQRVENARTPTKTTAVVEHAIAAHLRQRHFVQAVAGEQVQPLALPPNADQAIGAAPTGVSSRIALKGLEVPGRAVNHVRLGVLRPGHQILMLTATIQNSQLSGRFRAVSVQSLAHICYSVRCANCICGPQTEATVAVDRVP